jgi:glucose-1-phosphate cytidylyltransferase
VKAVILCGGKGTRIREASELIPKPLLPIGGKPIVWHIMKGFAAFGVTDFVLCLGHKGWLIKEFFLNYLAMTSDVTVTLGSRDRIEFHGRLDEEDWRVTLVETGEETQTGGRVAAARKYLEGDDLFLLTYGDGVADIDIRELIAFHLRHGRIATVTGVRPPSRFGEMELEEKKVVSFNEKPQATTGFINGGYFVLDGPRVWPYLPSDPALVLERDPLQRLAQADELRCFEHAGFWQPMDTLREYSLLNELWDRGTAPWKVW